MNRSCMLRWLCTLVGLTLAVPATAQTQVAFDTQVQPLLRKYCAGCHGAEEANAELRLDSFVSIQKGSENGQILARGDAKASRLIQVLNADDDSRMPPEDSPQLTQEQIDVLVAWVNSGAKGPKDSVPLLIVPQVKAAAARPAVTAIAVAPATAHQAVARFRTVEIQDPKASTSATWEGHAGKVNDLEFSPDGRWLAAASGVAGLRGEIRMRDMQTGKVVKTLRGHEDTTYAIDFSTDGKYLVSGSYDKSIVIWDVAAGKQVKTLRGHNDAVYDVKFSPDGTLVASASGDETVKIWHVESGQRLDTLGQPLAEQYTIAFSPDGRLLAAGGVDNRIRVYRIISKQKPRINPLLFARFGHERPIVQLGFTPDGKRLVSAGEDGTIKVWDTRRFVQTAALAKTQDVPTALVANNQQIVVGSADGSVDRRPLPKTGHRAESSAARVENIATADQGPMDSTSENEPNDALDHANPIQLPVKVTGVIHCPDPSDVRDTDVDLFRFQADEGDAWVFETHAARNQSRLDSRIEILDETGAVVPRIQLQAVRDSYITFRGINSSTADVRLHNWEEMDLNQYLYINGEVTRLFLYPRGPDSGFQLYKKGGRRRTYFDTSAMTHPLHQPCYIVTPIPRGTTPVPNGLPQFTVPYENDDDHEGRLQGDSRLRFVAPRTAEYVVRISDVRREQGEQYTYELLARSPKPDFNVRLSMSQQTVNASSGREFVVEADRIDGYDGPISVQIAGVPEGWNITSPIEIQAGHYTARGTVNATAAAPMLTAAIRKNIRVMASARVGEKTIEKQVPAFDKLQLTTEPKILISLTPAADQPPGFMRRKWQRATVNRATAQSSATLSVLDDHRVLASGDSPEQDRYEIDLQTNLKHLAALKLLLPGHKSLPAGAAGREPKVGNFVLTGLEIYQLGNDGEPQKVGIRSIKADYSQPGWNVSKLLDGNPKTGWAVAEQQKDKSWAVKRNGKDPSHWCEIELTELVQSDEGVRLRLVLHQSSDVKQATIGCFAINACEPIAVPAIPELVIRPGQTVTAALRVDRKAFDGRIQFESLNLNLPHGVIVDNIGLNGVLIPEKQTTRTVFFTAASWVPPTSRLIYFKANQDGSQTSWPLRLRVVAE